MPAALLGDCHLASYVWPGGGSHRILLGIRSTGCITRVVDRVVGNTQQEMVSKVLHVDGAFSDHPMINMGNQTINNNQGKGF